AHLALFLGRPDGIAAQQASGFFETARQTLARTSASGQQTVIQEALSRRDAITAGLARGGAPSNFFRSQEVVPLGMAQCGPEGSGDGVAFTDIFQIVGHPYRGWRGLFVGEHSYSCRKNRIISDGRGRL